MKARHLLLLGLVALAAAGCPRQSQTTQTLHMPRPLVGMHGQPPPAPVSPCDAPGGLAMKLAKLDFTTITGEKMSLGAGSSLKDKVVIVDFWAMLCTGCIDGLKHYQADPELLNNPKVQIIAFCMDTSEPAVKAFVKEKGFTFPVAMATDEIKQAFGVTGQVVLPQVRILEHNGVVRAQLGPEQATPDVIKCLVEKLVQGTGTTPPK